jgi:hypothetical protein
MIERQFEAFAVACDHPAPAHDDEIMRPLSGLERDKISHQAPRAKPGPFDLAFDLMAFGIAQGAVGQADDASAR